MKDIYNFSAGPAVLPREVLQTAQAELLDWHGSGMSVMEMSHRGKEFTHIITEAEADLRRLLAIPDNYKVLFLQGGATSQFAMIPMNLLRGKTSLDLVMTGQWAKAAAKEAARYAKVNIVASNEAQNCADLPDEATWQCSAEAAYLHYVSNETIGGVQFQHIPTVAHDVPLVCDMSSDFLSRPVDVSRFGLIFAGAQKNIGPAGLTVVIVREDLIGQTQAGTPTMFDYRAHAEAASMINTPPTFAIYMAGLVFKWLLNQGGVAAIEQRNTQKAAVLYQAIDDSDGFYRCPVVRSVRSKMNVPIRIREEALEAVFLKEAEAAGLLQLKGHRSVGGLRASIYNAMPLAGVQALVAFMQDFARRNG